MRSCLLEVSEAEYNSEQHLTDAEDDRNLHFERVEPRYFVLRQLPRLQSNNATHSVTKLFS